MASFAAKFMRVQICNELKHTPFKTTPTYAVKKSGKEPYQLFFFFKNTPSQTYSKSKKYYF